MTAVLFVSKAACAETVRYSLSLSTLASRDSDLCVISVKGREATTAPSLGLDCTHMSHVSDARLLHTARRPTIVDAHSSARGVD